MTFCRALAGLVTEGDTYEETRARVKETIEGYLESQKDGQPFPADKMELRRASGDACAIIQTLSHGSP